MAARKTAAAKTADGSSSSTKGAKHAKGKTPVADLQQALGKGEHEPVTFAALAHILDAPGASSSDDATGSSSSSGATAQ